MRINFWTILFLSIGISSCGQDDKLRGILVLTSERNDTSFDLFVPCDIDSDKTLSENLIGIDPGTARWISLAIANNYSEIVDSSTKLENENFRDFADRVRFVLVLPIEAEIDKRIDGKQYTDTLFEQFPVRLLGHDICKGYDPRQVDHLTNINILEVR